MPLFNAIDIRAAFNVPTAAFVAHVRVAGTYSTRYNGPVIKGDIHCMRGKGCIYILAQGDAISITIGNQTKTFMGVPTDASSEHN